MRAEWSGEDGSISGSMESEEADKNGCCGVRVTSAPSFKDAMADDPSCPELCVSGKAAERPPQLTARLSGKRAAASDKVRTLPDQSVTDPSTAVSSQSSVTVSVSQDGGLMEQRECRMPPGLCVLGEMPAGEVVAESPLAPPTGANAPDEGCEGGGVTRRSADTDKLGRQCSTATPRAPLTTTQSASGGDASPHGAKCVEVSSSPEGPPPPLTDTCSAATKGMCSASSGGEGDTASHGATFVEVSSSPEGPLPPLVFKVISATATSRGRHEPPCLPHAGW